MTKNGKDVNVNVGNDRERQLLMHSPPSREERDRAGHAAQSGRGVIRIGRAEEAGGKKKKLKLLFKLMIKLIIKLTRLCSEAVTYSSTGFMIITYNRENNNIFMK